MNSEVSRFGFPEQRTARWSSSTIVAETVSHVRKLFVEMRTWICENSQTGELHPRVSGIMWSNGYFQLLGGQN